MVLQLANFNPQPLLGRSGPNGAHALSRVGVGSRAGVVAVVVAAVQDQAHRPDSANWHRVLASGAAGVNGPPAQPRVGMGSRPGLAHAGPAATVLVPIQKHVHAALPSALVYGVAGASGLLAPLLVEEVGDKQEVARVVMETVPDSALSSGPAAHSSVVPLHGEAGVHGLPAHPNVGL